MILTIAILILLFLFLILVMPILMFVFDEFGRVIIGDDRVNKVMCFLGDHDLYINQKPTYCPKIRMDQVITSEMYGCIQTLKCQRPGCTYESGELL